MGNFNLPSQLSLYNKILLIVNLFANASSTSSTVYRLGEVTVHGGVQAFSAGSSGVGMCSTSSPHQPPVINVFGGKHAYASVSMAPGRERQSPGPSPFE